MNIGHRTYTVCQLVHIPTKFSIELTLVNANRTQVSVNRFSGHTQCSYTLVRLLLERTSSSFDFLVHLPLLRTRTEAFLAFLCLKHSFSLSKLSLCFDTFSMRRELLSCLTISPLAIVTCLSGLTGKMYDVGGRSSGRK